MALKLLAMLDSSQPLAGQVLVAESSGLVLAAISLRGRARRRPDPFFPTADLVELLRTRAERLEDRPAPRRRLLARRLLPAA